MTIRALLEMALAGAGYAEVASAARGDEGLALVKSHKPELVLLDLMLPGRDGYSIAKEIRTDPSLSETRIIMLTARTAPEDIVRGLEAGADDYVTKPYDRLVLLARIRAVLRRGPMYGSKVGFDGLEMDESNRSAVLDGHPLALTAGEFALLTKLVAHRGRILPRQADERTVDVQIANLRRKLGEWGSHIETVRGVGYRVSP